MFEPSSLLERGREFGRKLEQQRLKKNEGKWFIDDKGLLWQFRAEPHVQSDKCGWCHFHVYGRIASATQKESIWTWAERPERLQEVPASFAQQLLGYLLSVSLIGEPIAYLLPG